MSDLYGSLYARVLEPAYEVGLRRRPTLSRRAWLERTQWRPLDELRALQDAALRQLVRHAWQNVPLYRTRMEAAGVGADDVRTADDLIKLPVLTREQARDTSHERTSTVGPPLAIKKTTGGPTGQPLLFDYDR